MIERNDLSYTADDEGARIVEPQFSAEDTDVEFSLRPRKLNEYIGQEKVKENLGVYIAAAKIYRYIYRRQRKETKALTTFCCTVLPDLARQRLQE